MGVRRVIVQIDNLVLKGFRFEDRHAISAGLQEELSRLLAAPGIVQRLAQGGEIPPMRVGNVSIAANAKPQRIGIAAAQGISKGLTP